MGERDYDEYDGYIFICRKKWGPSSDEGTKGWAIAETIIAQARQ